MSAFVLDTSAVLAFLLQEPGGDEVATLLEGRAIISAVNVQELLVKLLSKGMTSRHARLTIQSLNLECHPHSMEDAEASAELTEHTKAKGLSLGDRSCLALAGKLGLPAVTADRVWSELAETVGVSVRVIR